MGLDELLGLVEPGGRLGAVTIVPAQRLPEFAQQVLLLAIQAHGRLDDDRAQKIAHAAAADRLQPHAAQPEDLAALCPLTDLELGLAIERRDFELAAEGGRHESDRDRAMQVRRARRSRAV